MVGMAVCILAKVHHRLCVLSCQVGAGLPRRGAGAEPPQKSERRGHSSIFAPGFSTAVEAARASIPATMALAVV